MAKKLTQEEFIERSNRIHNNKYDYSLVEYMNISTKVKIVCPKHDEFLQQPRMHLKGQSCSKCYFEHRKSNAEEFSQKSNIIHNNKYNYSKVNYITSKKKVIIICPEHEEFLQKPHDHLNGQGCPYCTVDDRKLNTEEFTQKSKKVHTEKYDYSKVIYIDTRTPVVIICSEHGEFLQKPTIHLSGSGCQSCAKSGFDQNKHGYCYYIKFESDNQTLYKIGITNLTINKRLMRMLVYKDYTPTILQELYFENGSDALNMETKILRDYKEFRYKGDKIMQNGNTELFTKDILNLDIINTYK
jgi:hypothetical protein